MATAVINKTNNGTAKKIKAIDYPIAKISYSKPTARITNTVPFRVKFSNIVIPGYGPNNPPPIGIAIIGFNNYIL
jgi:hypothetical protein